MKDDFSEFSVYGNRASIEAFVSPRYPLRSQTTNKVRRVGQSREVDRLMAEYEIQQSSLQVFKDPSLDTDRQILMYSPAHG
jgi:hypothetical protein